MTLTFDELWDRLTAADESVEIEAKTASQIGSSMLETVCAFANEPNREGGYLLLGVRPAQNTLFAIDYDVVGIPDPDKIQTDLATQCASAFNVTIRPQITATSRPGGETVVVAFIPEAQPHEKPVYLRSKGLPRGAYRRIAGTDQVCTDDDVQALYQGREHHSFDETLIEGANLDDLDSGAIDEYRRVRQAANPDAPELNYSTEDLLLSLFCASRHKGRIVPTLAGLLLFGGRPALRRYMPMMRLDYIRVPGREWVPDPDKRFESIEIRDPLMLAIPRAISAILDDIPSAFHLPANADQRSDIPLVPRTAIREAVVNAVMHRSYRQRSPVQIIRYANRLELRNPGHSLVPDDRLGEPGSLTRNEKTAAVLHETRYAETKGSGIRAMREALDQAGLTPPTFESDREKDTFVVTFLFHHFLNADDVQWLGRFADMALSEDEQRALVFAREIGAINNAAYRDINHVETLVASGKLRHLRDLGLLKQKGKAAGTYYVPTSRLVQPETPAAPGEFGQIVPPGQPTPAVTPKPATPTPAISRQSQGFDALAQRFPGLPDDLLAAVIGLGRRCRPEQAKNVIARLCAWRPLRAEDIAAILGRGRAYVNRTYLGPMIREGQLEYVHPDQPAHPQQAYRTATTRQGGE